MKKSRTYLQGHETIFYTYYNPLQYIHTKPHLGDYLAHWLQFLDQYRLHSIYGPGKQNTIASALYRFKDHQQEQKV